MKIFIAVSFIISAFTQSAMAQPTWKLTKNQDGIAVYQGESGSSPFKSIKVECTIDGTYNKLLAVLTNVGRHREWVYNNKTASLLKTVSPLEFYYYTETTLPWPMSNRDAVMHTTITKDSLNRFLKVSSVADGGYSEEKSGKVRIKRSAVNWHVTMPTASTIRIVYTLEADPGGSIPAWMVNSFVDKGPYESFKKLKALLKS